MPIMKHCREGRVLCLCFFKVQYNFNGQDFFKLFEVPGYS